MRKKIGNYLKTIYLLVFITTLNTLIYAQSARLTVKVDPKEVAMGESFNLEFHIETELDGDPKVSFNAPNAEILGQTGKRISSSSTYINGSWKTKQEIIVGYELSPKRAGKIFINKLKAEFNGEVLSHKMVFVNVLSQARENPNIFARVELSKDEAFIGESVIANYYLYFKPETPLQNPAIKKFPVFNKFIKRMHEIRGRDESVSYNGEIYKRRLVYSLQLFPEKEGELEIDPILLDVTYIKRRKSRFGMGMGFGLSSAVKRSIRSQQRKLKVYALPSQDVPTNFVGLVDEHDFKLEINRTKFLVNEPIELKLTVSGEGALEKLDPPRLILSDMVEEFETNSDLKISRNYSGVKTINYTYLARKPGVLSEEVINFWYFHPESNSYKKVEVTMPQITIHGSVSKAETGKKENALSLKNESSSPDQAGGKINKELTLLSPFGNSQLKSINLYSSLHILFLVCLFSFVGFSLKSRNNFLLELFWKKKNSNIVEYAGFIKIMSPLVKKYPGKSINEIIKKLDLPEQTKQYFLDLYGKMEEDYFKDRNSKKSYKLDQGHINQLEKYLGIN